MTAHDGGVAAHARAVLTTLDRARVELGALDRAVYGGVASTPSPTIDAAVARISNAANYSRLWMVTAALLGATGPTGRRAALVGLTAVGSASAVSNLVVKPVMSRGRPERTDSARSQGVRMPESHSFPSGHTASAFAFSSAVGGELPALATPLRLMATAVAYSRVHTGVHYPGDVLIGALLGAGIGTATRLLAQRTGWAVVSGR